MSHLQQHEFIISVKQKYPEYFENKIVLEVGSHNINGSIRPHFNNCAYIGLDAGPGKDVDVISLAHEYNLPDKTFDTIVSCEMFEHDQYWEKSFANIIRLCKNQGLIMFSCATTGRKIHGTLYNEPHSSPNTVDLGWEYYRNLTEQDFKNEFNFDNLFDEYEFKVNRYVFDLYFWGIKK